MEIQLFYNKKLTIIKLLIYSYFNNISMITSFDSNQLLETIINRLFFFRYHL